MLFFIIYILVYCIYGSVWGVVVNKIIKNKGYYENWFWWGFFFGFLALIVALTKPAASRTTENSKDYFNSNNSMTERDYVFRDNSERQNEWISGGWRCRNCGKINADYVGTCGCGCDKSGNMPEVNSEQIQRTDTGLYCPHCGKPLEADSVFCRYCGTKNQ